MIQSNGENLKHADSNGDGIINDNDTLAINLNFTLSHAFIPQSSDLRTTNPDLFFVTSSSTYQPGDIIDLEIWAGSAILPSNNLYGIAFDINYDLPLVQPGTEELSYPISWLGTPGVNVIKIGMIDPLLGIANVAITRTNHTNANGYGKIANLKFQAKIGISAPSSMNFSIVNYSANDSIGVPILYNSIPYSILINPYGTGVNNINSLHEINVYPNPYFESTQIFYSLINKSFVTIEIYNTIGQKIETLVNNEQQPGEYKCSFSAKQEGYDAGVYFVKFIIDGKVTMKRLVEIK